jgi:release factor glutamine methyltransferase
MQRYHVIQLIAQQLEQAGIENPLREARLIVHYTTGIPYLSLITEAREELSKNDLALIQEWTVRRCAREPLAKIIGKKEFWGLSFTVSKDTLDPRPDSETLIQAVLDHYPDKNTPWTILDLGTGTGCLILSLLHEYPNAQGVAVDLSQAALHIAKQNAAQLKLQNRVTFVQSDWTKSLKGDFDIVISNPPYIPLATVLDHEVSQYDPPTALFAGPSGMDAYQEIAKTIYFFMRPSALLFVEIGFGQTDEVEKIFNSNNFTTIKRCPDLAGIPRCLIFSKKRG